MKNKVKKKHYLKIEFSLASPLSVGSGKNEQTDKDIMRRKDGTPFIPGSALAGVFRTLLEEMGVDVERYFGNVEIDTEESVKENDKSQRIIESRLVFFDANPSDANYITSTRDQVALDVETKTALEGMKFDMEIVEPGLCFTTYIMQNLYLDEGELDLSDLMISIWKSGAVCFGTKTTRGYGKIRLESVGEYVFKLDSKDNVYTWLDFDMFEADGWKVPGSTTAYILPGKMVKLRMKLRGGLSIRKYTTDIRKSEDETMPDYEPLTVHVPNRPDGIPVIPGTSWAGAFRSHMVELQKGSTTEKCYFGAKSYYENKIQKGKKSSIKFSETQITGGKPVVISRNAINRFTGGTVDGALFTEKVWYGGETELVIEYDDMMPMITKQTLAAAILDLHYGYMAVGGLTSVGRGIFEIESINGKRLFETVEEAGENYKIVMKALGTEV